MGCLALFLTMCGALVTGSEVDVWRPFDLTVERRKNPIGIDVDRPRFSWKLPIGEKEASAYELEIDGRSFGKVLTSEQVDRTVEGLALPTGSRHVWRVRVWNLDGKVSGWSQTASFTMGVMDAADWKARWIGPNAITRPDVDFGGAKWVTSTTGVLRATFELKEIPATKEIVFLSRSPYLLTVNGRRSRGSFDGHDWTPRFAKYHDLSNDELRIGENTIEFTVLEKNPASH